MDDLYKSSNEDSKRKVVEALDSLSKLVDSVSEKTSGVNDPSLKKSLMSFEDSLRDELAELDVIAEEVYGVESQPKHYGPGPHKSGSSQDVHTSKTASATVPASQPKQGAKGGTAGGSVNDELKRYKPFESIGDSVNEEWIATLKLPTKDDILNKLVGTYGPRGDKKDKRLLAHKNRELPEGEVTKLRIDIPYYNTYNQFVVAFHESPGGRKIGAVKGFDHIGRVNGGVEFSSGEKGALSIMKGKNKWPLAVITGKLVQSQEIPSDINDWTPVGYNPEKAVFFYDKRGKGREVVGGDEAISIGNTVFVKNPKYGDRNAVENYADWRSARRAKKKSLGASDVSYWREFLTEDEINDPEFLAMYGIDLEELDSDSKKKSFRLKADSVAKSVSDVDLKPTESMASNAKRGLELRKKHGKGGTSVGVARARDISNRKQMSPETVSRMVSFFARHDGNQSGGEDDAGYISWLLWGGDSGKTWAESKKRALDNASKKKSATISYNPDAYDHDGDGYVQDGTPYERSQGEKLSSKEEKQAESELEELQSRPEPEEAADPQMPDSEISEMTPEEGAISNNLDESIARWMDMYDQEEIVIAEFEYEPELKDTSGDGVENFAKVGVPSMDVPPPPAIPRLPNLTPDERAVEDSFASAFEANPDRMVDKFRDKMLNGDLGDSPVVFATDEAKGLHPVWKDKEQRSTYNTALHQTANAIAKRAFIEHLDEIVMQLPEDQRHVLVTAGGVSAGKGFSIANNPEISSIASKAAAIWDSAGEQNSTEMPWVASELEKRGIKATFVYVHADPRKMWTNPDFGAVKRAEKKGRMVDAHLYADSYVHGSKNFKAFHDAHKSNENMQFAYIDSTDGMAVKPEMPSQATSLDRSELYKESVDHLLASESTPDWIKRGGSTGLRIWGKPQEKTNAGQ